MESSVTSGRVLVVLSGILGIVGWALIAFASYGLRTANSDSAAGFALLWLMGAVLVVFSSMAFTLGMLRWAIVPAISVLSQQNARIILLLEQIAKPAEPSSRPKAAARDDAEVAKWLEQ